MFKQLRKNNSGIIMVTVLMLTVILSVVAISVMSINVSQVTSSTDVKNNIRAKELAIGAFYQYYTQKFEGLGTNLNGVSENINGTAFTISIVDKATVPAMGGAGPNTTDQVNITVTY